MLSTRQAPRLLLMASPSRGSVVDRLWAEMPRNGGDLLRLIAMPHTTHPQNAYEALIARAAMAAQTEGWAMGSDEPSSFGRLLLLYRTAARLTQDELAERPGLSARGIQDLDCCVRRSPHPDAARRLTEALGWGCPAHGAARCTRPGSLNSRLHKNSPLIGCYAHRAICRSSRALGQMIFTTIRPPVALDLGDQFIWRTSERRPSW